VKIPRIPYWELLIGPWLALGLGFLSNALVMAANGGQMPVLMPPGFGGIPADDWIHCVMTAQTHLKFLADWIVIRDMGIASPGDFLEWAYELSVTPLFVAWGALTLKKHHDAEVAKGK
jgi:hypothetical protein